MNLHTAKTCPLFQLRAEISGLRLQVATRRGNVDDVVAKINELQAILAEREASQKKGR